MADIAPAAPRNLQLEMAGEVSPPPSPFRVISSDSLIEINEESLPGPQHIVTPRDFELLKVLGTGSYGKVLLVRKVTGVDAGTLYAMKVLKKASIVREKEVAHTRSERNILEAIRQIPFVVHLHYAFQDDSKLHLVLDYINGGELFTHLSRRRLFSEQEAGIYIAELVVALNSLHELGIIYRDLKLENVLIDSEGHIVLTDFGLCKEHVPRQGRSYSYVGTVEYMAPEIIAQSGHSFEVDWWSTGALLFELVTGATPFFDEYDDSTKSLSRRIQTDEPDYPSSFSKPLRALLNGLLQKDPRKRFRVEDIKGCAFFQQMDWKAVEERRIVPPFVPIISDPMDVTNFDADFTDRPAILTPAPAREVFRGFSFVSPDVLYGTPLFQPPPPATSLPPHLRTSSGSTHSPLMRSVTAGSGSASQLAFPSSSTTASTPTSPTVTTTPTATATPTTPTTSTLTQVADSSGRNPNLALTFSGAVSQMTSSPLSVGTPTATSSDFSKKPPKTMKIKMTLPTMQKKALHSDGKQGVSSNFSSTHSSTRSSTRTTTPKLPDTLPLSSASAFATPPASRSPVLSPTADPSRVAFLGATSSRPPLFSSSSLGASVWGTTPLVSSSASAEVSQDGSQQARTERTKTKTTGSARSTANGAKGFLSSEQRSIRSAAPVVGGTAAPHSLHITPAPMVSATASDSTATTPFHLSTRKVDLDKSTDLFSYLQTPTPTSERAYALNPAQDHHVTSSARHTLVQPTEGDDDAHDGILESAGSTLQAIPFQMSDNAEETESALRQFGVKYIMLDQVLGSGTFSICKRCRNRMTGDDYAVKIVSRRKGGNIQREIDMLKRCQGHPSVVKLVDVVEDALHVYLVMELIAGGELFDRIRSPTQRPRTEAQVRKTFKALVSVVQYLHSQGIVHRDIKLENVMLVGRGWSQIKLIDFGFARPVTSTAVGTPCFTTDYAAPELFTLQNLPASSTTDPPFATATATSMFAADVWSMGIVLYTLLCGHLPPATARITGGPAADRMAQCPYSSIEFPPHLWEFISPEAVSLVQQMLQTDASKRLSATQILQHTWMQSSNAHELPVSLEPEPTHQPPTFQFTKTRKSSTSSTSSLSSPTRRIAFPTTKLGSVAEASLAKRRQKQSSASKRSKSTSSSQSSAGDPINP
eukprot:m.205338 g.205338  ORF g.205338 m.205338 type:complete len:1155 (-) comp15015_c0_seq1:244-3708(-)